MAEKLRGELGGKIIATLDLPRLMRQIVAIVRGILTGSEDSQTDRQVVEFGMATLLAIVLYSKDCLAKV